jgi:hypothetical protein
MNFNGIKLYWDQIPFVLSYLGWLNLIDLEIKYDDPIPTQLNTTI